MSKPTNFRVHFIRNGEKEHTDVFGVDNPESARQSVRRAFDKVRITKVKILKGTGV